MKTVNTLVMTFVCADGEKASITLENPASDITPTKVKEVMDIVIAQGALRGSKGLYEMVTAHSAQIVQRTVTGLNIE